VLGIGLAPGLGCWPGYGRPLAYPSGPGVPLGRRWYVTLYVIGFTYKPGQKIVYLSAEISDCVGSA